MRDLSSEASAEEGTHHFRRVLEIGPAIDTVENMSKVCQTSRIETYLEKRARPIDLARYDFHFRGGDASAVLRALKPYQNDDGGFGHALEPDVCLPQSTALATGVAFQFINEVDPDPMNEVLRGGLMYLLNAYDRERNGWAVVPLEVDCHPHAPWWDYETAMAHFGWGNPSAGILGVLVKYRHVVDAEEIIGAATEKALKRICEVDPSSFHEVLNFKTLYQLADEGLKEQLKDPLARLISESACLSPDEWKSYVATPLKFVSSPDDPFIDLFDKGLIEANLQFLADEIVGGDHWEPNWNWAGTYPGDWEIARQEWSGHITVANSLRKV